MNDPLKVWAEIYALVFGDQYAKDAAEAVAEAVAPELERLHAAVTELGNKYVREEQRVQHCETCVHQDGELCRGAGSQ